MPHPLYAETLFLGRECAEPSYTACPCRAGTRIDCGTMDPDLVDVANKRSGALCVKVVSTDVERVSVVV